jgi:hypothetical protein
MEQSNYFVIFFLETSYGACAGDVFRHGESDECDSSNVIETRGGHVTFVPEAAALVCSLQLRWYYAANKVSTIRHTPTKRIMSMIINSWRFIPKLSST